jgi:MFS family permease
VLVSLRRVPGTEPAGRDARRQQVQDRLNGSGRYPRWVLLTALTGMFATTFPVTLLAVSLPTIAEDFGVRETLIAWVIAAPLLGSAVALPILGKLGDLYGHRRVFLTGFAISTLVTAITTLAWDPYSLIVLRSLAVMIGAATIPSSMALINSVHAPAERAKAMGWWSLVAAGAPAIGLVVGGPMIDAVGWRPMFGIQAALSIVPVMAAFLVLRETPRRTDVGFDVPGAISLGLGAGGLMVALNQWPEQGFGPLVALALVTGVGGIVAFVAIESRVRYPLLPLELFRRRNFTTSVLATFTSGAAYMGGFVLAPLLLQSVFAFSVSATSLVILARTASFSASSPLGGFTSARWGERPVAVAGCLSIALALVGLGLGADADSVVIVVGALLVQGVGNGFSQPPITATLSNSVEDADLGIAAAAQRMAWQAGSAFGITTMTTVYGGTERAEDFLAAYLAGAGLGLAAMVFAAMMRSTPRDRTGEQTVDAADEHVPATAAD